MMQTESNCAVDAQPEGARTRDRTDFYATMRPSDVFICSYPKSGATWLGYLLAQLTAATPQREPMGLDAFHQFVPDVNLAYTQGGSLAMYAKLAEPRFFLCHAACDQRLPRVVYILRDPRDTMVSYWHYQKFLDRKDNLSLGQFVGQGHWPCEWDQHVAGWLLPRRHPKLLLLTYEQLHQDLPACLDRLIEFVGLRCSPARVESAIEASRFENMRAAEERFGVESKKGDENERFIRRGRVGSWQQEMGYAELSLLEERYGKVMREVGYQPMS